MLYPCSRLPDLRPFPLFADKPESRPSIAFEERPNPVDVLASDLVSTEAGGFDELASFLDAEPLVPPFPIFTDDLPAAVGVADCLAVDIFSDVGEGDCVERDALAADACDQLSVCQLVHLLETTRGVDFDADMLLIDRLSAAVAALNTALPKALRSEGGIGSPPHALSSSTSLSSLAAVAPASTLQPADHSRWADVPDGNEDPVVSPPAPGRHIHFGCLDPCDSDPTRDDLRFASGDRVTCWVEERGKASSYWPGGWLPARVLRLWPKDDVPYLVELSHPDCPKFVSCLRRGKGKSKGKSFRCICFDGESMFVTSDEPDLICHREYWLHASPVWAGVV